MTNLRDQAARGFGEHYGRGACATWRGHGQNARDTRRQTACALVLFMLLVRVLVGAEVREEIKGIVEREYPGLEKIYLGVHGAPELSLMEEKTAEFLAGEMRKVGFEVTEKVGGYGVVGV